MCLARGPVGAGLLDELLAEEEEASGKKAGKKAKRKAKAKGSKGAKDDDGSAADDADEAELAPTRTAPPRKRQRQRGVRGRGQ